MTADDHPGTHAVELVGHDPTRARSVATRVLAEHDRPAVRAAALRALALVHREYGDTRKARLLLRRAWFEADGAGDRGEAELARGGIDGLMALHHPRGSSRAFRDALGTHGLLRQGVRQTQLGALVDARHSFTAVLLRSADPQVQVAALLGQGEAQLTAGALADASDQLERALAVAEAGALHYLGALVRQCAARLAARTGDPAAALTAMDAAVPWLRGERAADLAFERAGVLSDAGLSAEAESVVAGHLPPTPHGRRVTRLWARAQDAVRRRDTTSALDYVRRLRALPGPGPWVGAHVERQARSVAPGGRPILLSPSRAPAMRPTVRTLLARFRRTWLLAHANNGQRSASPTLRSELAVLARRIHDGYRASAEGHVSVPAPPNRVVPTVRFREVGGDVVAEVTAHGTSSTRRIGTVTQVRATVAGVRSAVWRGTEARTGPRGEALWPLAEAVLPTALSLPERGPVTIAPHGALWQVPWGMLPRLRGREVRVLGPPPVTLAPGESDRGPVSVTLVAGPSATSASEIRKLGALRPDARTLTGQDAVCSQVSDAMSRGGLVHVAGHGVAGYHRMGGGILLTDGPYTGYDLWLAARPPRVLVLSACGPAGSTPLGLPLAAIRHGVAVVIASVVPVRDTLLPAAMLATHRSLLDGVPPARAVDRHLAHLGFVVFSRE
ncbi:CHAT domain-containing protein [Spiractinospora alimapuensis]|uniref:CHAT domain-containing protein n=1 Tax=Spiractinospora alimapuensis TaxID=2820884 RepID=UPI001F18EBF7|nr:CHAT domain-containing protein [Spiractinospora alimapuensis]QVQ53531.1 CHAT domain-containing protein [Spiractinospora alimapuensis]